MDGEQYNSFEIIMKGNMANLNREERNMLEKGMKDKKQKAIDEEDKCCNFKSK